MKKYLHIAIITAILCVLFAGPAWANGSFADVAFNEYTSQIQEDPMGSDCVKYNEWYYGGRVSNPFDHGEYVQQFNWNTTFVSWCAEQVGYTTLSVIPRTCSISEMYVYFLDHGYPSYTPQSVVSSEGDLQIDAGDIMFFTTDAGAQCVCIVTYADYYGISCVIGDSCGIVDAFHADYPDLPESACIFHIPPIQNDNISTIVLFLQQEMNLNPAAVCGIATNIMYESKGSYSCIGDNGYSAGICQWHNDRFGSLVKFCDMYGYDWFSLEGQLQFLKYELEGPYRGLLDMINTSENSPEGAYEAAYLFCLDFERPEDMTKKAVIRGQDAHDIYYPLWYGR